MAKDKIPSLKERLSRWSSFGPLAISAAHVPGVMSRIDPRTERALANKPGLVGVIPFRGAVVPREDRYSQMFGEVGVENTVQRIAVMMADKSIKVIILDVDSPGGNVQGVMEAVAAVRAMNRTKPIVAHADYTMASAAYHFSMCADEVSANPSADVGAVGVLAPFIDEQAALELMGLKATSFAYPADKGDGWGMWPNSEKFEERRMEGVKTAYNNFVSDILAARPGVTAEDILAEWAGVYSGPKAKLLGMVDKVRTIADTFGAYSAPDTGASALAGRKAHIRILRLKGH